MRLRHHTPTFASKLLALGTLMLVLILIAATVTPATAQGIKIGDPAPMLRFTAPDSSTLTLDPSKASATVVVFVSEQCPVSNSYNGRMSALYQAYAGKPVQFAFVDANATESPQDIVALETRAKFPFRVLRDVSNVVADQLNAQFTPEVYVFDKGGILRYHGAIDDSRNVANVQQQSARDAIDALVDGKPVAVATTKAFGCSIKRVRTS
jgi:hypothetical protein